MLDGSLSPRKQMPKWDSQPVCLNPTIAKAHVVHTDDGELGMSAPDAFKLMAATAEAHAERQRVKAELLRREAELQVMRVAHAASKEQLDALRLSREELGVLTAELEHKLRHSDDKTRRMGKKLRKENESASQAREEMQEARDEAARLRVELEETQLRLRDTEVRLQMAVQDAEQQRSALEESQVMMGRSGGGAG